jgi:hypothetical protein
MQAPPAVDPAVHAVNARLRLEARFRSGANWFFWIAAMSLINSMVGFFGGQWGFVIGLGLTQVIDAMLASQGPSVVGPLLTAGVAGVFVACGHFAREGRRAAFIGGIVVYVLDSLIFVVVRDYLAIAFHGFALYCLIKGMHAKDQLDNLSARSAPMRAPAELARTSTSEE